MSVKFKVPIEVDGKVSAEYLDLSTTTTRVVDAGEIAWNSIDGTFDIGLLNGVTLQAGQEMHFYGKATEAISNGNAVMFAGVQGDHILIAKADAATINANPEYFMGVATQDFTTNQFGYVTAFGNVRGLNTSAYTLGDILYFDSTSATDGLLTATEPSAPNAKIIVAAVVRVHATQGILAVRPHTMPKLKDIQDVNVDTATTGEILQLQSTGVWENKTLSEAGIISGSGTTNYVSKFTGSTTLGNSQLFDNGTNVGVGTSTPANLLQVVRNQTSDTAIVVSNTGTAGATTTMSFVLQESGTPQGWFRRYRDGSGLNEIGFSTDLAFSGNVTSTKAERMRITSAGNVGIGTSSPTVRLDVSGAVNVRSAAPTITFDRNSSYTWRLVNGDGVTYPTSTFNIANNAGTSVATFLDSGNVGIGTTSPTTLLDVRGGFNVSDGTSTVRIVNSGGVGLIGTLTTHPLAIRTDNTERMRITSSGNVGIGTSAPSIKFQVETSVNGSDGIWARNTNTGTSAFGSINCVSGVGAINLRAYSAAHTAWPSTSMINSASAFTGGMALFQDGANPISLWTNGSERMRVTSAGNIGIGTTSPSGRLHVVGTSPSVFVDTSNTFAVSIGAASATPNIVAIGTSGSGIPQIQGYTTGFGATANLSLQPNGANVGIGTTSADSRLHISSTASNLLRMVRTGGTATNFGFELGSGAIGLYNYSTSTYGWYLGSTGNLGIGTTSPGAKLDVEAATTGYAAIIKNTTAGGDYLKMTGDSGNTAFEFGSGGTGADAFLNMYADNTQKVLVNADGNSYFNGGNVGIGTTSPVQKLDVSGSIKASGSVQVGDDSTIASATNVGATRYRSDANNSYMDMVMQTGASTYAWVNVVQNNW